MFRYSMFVKRIESLRSEQGVAEGAARKAECCGRAVNADDLIAAAETAGDLANYCSGNSLVQIED